MRLPRNLHRGFPYCQSLVYHKNWKNKSLNQNAHNANNYRNNRANNNSVYYKTRVIYNSRLETGKGWSKIRVMQGPRGNYYVLKRNYNVNFVRYRNHSVQMPRVRYNRNINNNWLDYENNWTKEASGQ